MTFSQIIIFFIVHWSFTKRNSQNKPVKTTKMPLIKIERIVSFTSEDPNHQASNILSSDSTKKWKCKSAGEKSSSVVLQLDQPYIISSIDIGNENSAYIEVLVSRSSSPEDFKALLVMSSFMSPLDARQSQNVNKVRMFKQKDLVEPERNEKWDRVKIVCTQPFNRHVQYGLSFVNFHTSSNKDEEKALSIGNFIIRPKSPDNITVGSLFARRKLQESSGEGAPKGLFATSRAAAIKEANLLTHSGSPVPKQKIKQNLQMTAKPTNKEKINYDDGGESKARNRNELLYNKDEEGKHEKIDKLVEKRNKEKGDKTAEKEEQIIKQKNKDKAKRLEKHKAQKNSPLTNKKPSDNSKAGSINESKKRKTDDNFTYKAKKQKKVKKGKPFGRLLEDIVLVISGIQNPDRASLRSMALSMGAKYKSDWDSSCTHLICAFVNTPKFNQVKGKGKIVKMEWLEDCYNKRKKLPWRRYALDKDDRGPESEEEVCEEEANLLPNRERNENLNTNSDYDMREQYSDTDEKLEKIIRKQSEESSKQNIFSIDTEDESLTLTDKSPKTPEIKRKLENFFEDQIFYVDETFDDEMQKKIKQYIVAYNGVLVENLEASIDIAITNEENFKTLKEIYPSATCVAPDWIWECHNCQRLMPIKDYIYE
ncbi:DNA repair protein XRCC1 [Euwallacea similis]|uniref:DNA repair protein XRCC1 n=1 Tax=Euwallacea similis TaxID=1736056 RepID=UPI00344E4053